MEKIIKGLTIINKYENASISAEHDIIYLWARGVSEEDQKEMLKLEWSNDEPNHWFTFV